MQFTIFVMECFTHFSDSFFTCTQTFKILCGKWHYIPKELKNSDDYTYRHMGNSDISTQKILTYLGYDSIDGLMNDVVPEKIRLNKNNMFNHNGKTLKGICSETLMLERIR